MKFLRFLVPVLILGACLGVASYLLATKPEPVRRMPPPTVTVIKAMRIQPQEYQTYIMSQGAVKPRTESTLKPQVSGRILEISPSFREGGFFEKDDWLLTIDPRDYETAVTVAEAALAQNQSELELEKAQHEQALENWKQLGDGTEPSPLTLRLPQLAEQKAKVASAAARLEEAKRNLERTQIKAPYAGLIMKKEADVGQVVSPGNTLASIFAVDYVEIRLPLRQNDLDFVDIPEAYRGEQSSSIAGPKVILTDRLGSREVSWEGTVVRTESAYDNRTRMLFVVAQVDDPYDRTSQNAPPLKVGQFVRARIEGKLLQDVFVIPRNAVREGREVLVVKADNTIERRAIKILWEDEHNVVVRENLHAGEVVSLTPLQFATDGTPVLPQFEGERQGKPQP